MSLINLHQELLAMIPLVSRVIDKRRAYIT